jgi:hypothetical protein
LAFPRGYVCNQLKNKQKKLRIFAAIREKSFAEADLGEGEARDSQTFPQFLWISPESGFH